MQRDHSDIVKFSANDHDYDTVLHILEGMVERAADFQSRRITYLNRASEMAHGWAGVRPQDSALLASQIRNSAASLSTQSIEDGHVDSGTNQPSRR